MNFKLVNIFKLIIFNLVLKFPKRKNLDSAGEITKLPGSFTSLSILSKFYNFNYLFILFSLGSNDNRDIYHDFYKIANISQNNTEAKKK